MHCCGYDACAECVCKFKWTFWHSQNKQTTTTTITKQQQQQQQRNQQTRTEFKNRDKTNIWFTLLYSSQRGINNMKPKFGAFNQEKEIPSERTARETERSEQLKKKRMI